MQFEDVVALKESENFVRNTVCRFQLVILLLLVLHGHALADQLAWIKPDAADKVVKVLKPGKIFIYWPCNNPKKAPIILRVVKTWSEPVQSKVKEAKGLVSVFADVERVGHGEFDGDEKNVDENGLRKVKWKVSHGDGELMTLDIAYVFVNSAKSLSKFVNFGIALKLKSNVKTKTLQLPKITALKLRRKPVEKAPLPGENRAG